MSSERGVAQEVAEAIADGRVVDWPAAEASASGEDERDVIRRLRGIQTLASTGELAEAGRSPGSAWAHLRIIECIGSGAHSDVYRAWDPSLDREVALKILRRVGPAPTADSTIVEEGRLLARVQHANVVAVFGADGVGDSVGVWMELIEGQTLEALLEEHGPFGAHEVSVIGLELCRALAAVHAAGLLHRDIKAQNVMREHRGRIVLMDFGAGREAHDIPVSMGGDVAGTPLYLAPEVLRGEAASVGSDIYSLGVLLYHLATNRYPVVAATHSGLVEAHAKRECRLLRDVRPDYPERLVTTIQRAIAPDPSARFQSAGALEAALVESLSAWSTTDERASRNAVDVEPDRPRHVGRQGDVIRTEPASKPSRARLLNAAVGALVGAAAVLGVAWTYAGRTAVPAPPIAAIAVLPFEDVSTTRGDAYFVDGITEALTQRLARVDSVRVVSQASVGRYRDRPVPPDEIARELKVDALVQGSIERVGERLILRAGVVDTRTHQQVWSDRFEAPTSDVMALQNRVGQALVRAITGHAEGDGTGSAPSETVAPAAYEAYLRGRYWLNKRRGEDLLTSLVHFDEALGIEPTYAPAYAAMAEAYILLGSYSVIPMTESHPKARAAAMRALEIDETLAEAHVPLAAVEAEYGWNPSDAERHFQRAIALKPSYALAHQWYSDLLSALARHDEAIRHATIALELDPLSPIVQVTRGVRFYEARQHDAALVELDKVRRLNPGFVPVHIHLGLTYVQMGRHAEAIAALREAQRLGGSASTDTLALVGYAWAAAGNEREARNVLRELSRQTSTQPVKAMTVATIYGELGELDQAFAWLERARANREWLVAYVNILPTLDPLRHDPRFEAFTRLVVPGTNSPPAPENLRP